MSKVQHKQVTQASDEIDLGKLLGLLLDAKWLIAGVTSVFAVLGICYALMATPIYKADVLLQVETKSNGVSSMLGDMGEMFTTESSATTEIEIIKSRLILGQTVDKLGLTIIAEPDYLPLIGAGIARLTGDKRAIRVSEFELPASIAADPDAQAHTISLINADQGQYQLYNSQGDTVLTGTVGQLQEAQGYRIRVEAITGNAGDNYNVVKRSRLDAIQYLQRNLSISEQGKQTGILVLAFMGSNKADISDILDDISQNYFLQNVARNSAEAENSLTFLKSKLPEIKGQLDSSEELLNNFRQNNESVDLSLEAKSVLEVMVSLESQLNELTFKESEISQLYTKDHPAYKSLMDKRSVLLHQKDTINKQIQQLPQTQREVLRMTRDVEVNQQIYIQLLNKVQELGIVKASTVGNVRILDKAQAANAAVKPKKPLVVVLATLLGGMLAVGLVLVRAAINRGMESPDDIEALGLAVYASVPNSPAQLGLDKNQRSSKHSRKPSSSAEFAPVKHAFNQMLLAESNPADLSIEALRGLRTSLHFAMLEAKNNILMISGPSPSIGKSFVSANLAAIVAQSGQRVLLIDSDMRKGSMQRHFGLSHLNGLSEFLANTIPLKQAIKPSGVANLDLLTRGIAPPNPSELLMHARFGELMQQVATDYDIVIIDTPPILAVTDPAIIGAYVGTSLVVARYGKTSAKELEVSLNRFEQVGIEIKGAIFNGVEKRASNAYGYYNYSYKSEKS